MLGHIVEFFNVVTFSYLIVFITSLMLSALFSGYEAAIYAVLNSFENSGSDTTLKSDKGFFSYIYGSPRELLVTLLTGNIAANSTVAITGIVITKLSIDFFTLSTTSTYIVAFITILITILVFSESIPRAIAIQNPVRFTQRYYYLVRVFQFLFYPIAKVLAKSAIVLENRLPKSLNIISSDDIIDFTEENETNKSFDGEEREIFENVVEFRHTVVKEIMTSRVNISAVSTEDALGDVIELIKEKKLSRLPLYTNNLDSIVGIIYAKDLLPYLKTEFQNITINWKTIARKALFVPTTKRLDDLLSDFKREKSHIAIVVDEYGGTEGIITLDDLLEEIIGDIADETSDLHNLYTIVNENEYLFDAQIDLDDIEEILDVDLTTDEDEYETLGGLIYHLIEKIPETGEKVTYKNLELTVSVVENNRIKKVKVVKLLNDESQKIYETD